MRREGMSPILLRDTLPLIAVCTLQLRCKALKLTFGGYGVNVQVM
jgi:hypothetical protein